MTCLCQPQTHFHKLMLALDPNSPLWKLANLKKRRPLCPSNAFRKKKMEFYILLRL